MRIRGCLLFILCAITNAYEVFLSRSSKDSAASLGRSSNDSKRFNDTNSPTPKHVFPLPDDVQVRCRPLRAKRYLSDGHCTSMKPIREVVCAGQCLPIKEQNLPWWTEFIKYWSRNKLKEWRCVEDVTRRRRVKLLCKNGDIRTYRIKVVKSCKCKEYKTSDNETRIRKRRKNRRQRKRDRRRRHRKNRKRNRNQKNTNSQILTSNR